MMANKSTGVAGKICFTFVVLCVFFEGFSCEVVDLKPCVSETTNNESCTVNEVRITPCKDHPKPCTIKKGNAAGISFDFTPSFEAEKLKTMVYWANGVFELPFAGMDSDACKYTSCPVEAGKKRSFDYNLQINKAFPTNTYPLKFEVWNERNKEEKCCFMSAIRLKD